MFGVRRFCGIHDIYSGAVIRGDRQGLFYGKSEASRCDTHLLKAGSPFVEVRHRRITLTMKRTVTRPFFYAIYKFPLIVLISKRHFWLPSIS